MICIKKASRQRNVSKPAKLPTVKGIYCVPRDSQNEANDVKVLPVNT